MNLRILIDYLIEQIVFDKFELRNKLKSLKIKIFQKSKMEERRKKY